MDLINHGIVGVVKNDSKFLLLEDSRALMLGFWAPPHGRCESKDISEENSVAREVLEETGLRVKPTKKLLTIWADTKVMTVSFWLVEVVGSYIVELDVRESSRYGWFSLEEAFALKLYPGTKEFFEQVQAGKITLE